MKSSFFSGKTVLVTGASRGIGESLARQLASQGANLILVARDVQRLETLKKELQGSSCNVELQPCDLSQPVQVRELADRRLAARSNPLDGVILNAGVGLFGEIAAVREEDVREIFEINFFSVRSLVSSLLPLLQKGRESRIVLVSTVISWRAIPRLGLYCASKGALNLLAEALRVELRNSGIAITTVYPGRTQTDFAENTKGAGPRAFPNFGGVSPEKAAKTILRAMRKGKRDAFVSFSDRILVWWNFFLPKTLDWILGKVLK